MLRILVTGTSSGFGTLTSLALARRGHTVIATMRDVDGRNRAAASSLLAAAEGLALRVVELDVTRDDSVTAGVAAAGPLDVVVNNAGHGMAGLVETVTPEQLLAVIDTNVIGIQRVNRAVLPAMRAARRGLVVHVSSGLGRVLYPFVGAYAATKWAVEALAEVLRAELKPTGVESTIVQPGAFPTQFAAVMGLGADQARASGYGPLAGGLAGFQDSLATMFAAPDYPSPQEVADAIVALVELPLGTRPPRVVVDRLTGAGVESLNAAHADVQRSAFAAIGMPVLAD